MIEGCICTGFTSASSLLSVVTVKSDFPVYLASFEEGFTTQTNISNESQRASMAKEKMMKRHGIIVLSLRYSISTVIFLLLFMTLSFVNQVEGSRPLTHKLSSISINKFKLSKAYSGPSNRGAGHAIIHTAHFPTPLINRLKITTTKPYSCSVPTETGIDHVGHTDPTTPIKRFNKAQPYSAPAYKGIGH
ncbi:hypothetical protein FNV43_RR11777 [Rhamnella rubrinervis]|uniref:Uncharacterized protein n=1 Tax=Rhamnella rubrinervis TaxID=2594499 RepID=A0A8K0H655_9ROSA|nr:hypothetical protein FNV43_RR11777 [Rhamnella rubrinervis]